MYKSFLVCLFMFLLCINVNSQTLDTINLDASEQQFRDSIALLNQQTEQLKASREAYNTGLLLLQNEISGIHDIINK